MFRPTQLELITKKVGESPLVCCAHKGYLQRRGTPQRAEDLATHDLVGYDRSDIMLRAAVGMGFDVTREDFVVRTDSQTANWELTKAGLGIGFAQELLVRSTPGMVALLPGFEPPPLELWLTTHRELFTSRRIRAIYDRLATGLTDYIARTSRRPGQLDTP